MTVTRRRVAAGCLAVLLVSGTLAACSDGDEPGPEPSGAASSETSAPADPAETPDDEGSSAAGTAAEARKALRTGQRQLFQANTGNIAVGVPLFDGIKIKDVGDYQIRPLRADLLRTCLLYTSPSPRD